MSSQRILYCRSNTETPLVGSPHAFTADDWTAMLDFFDKHLRGKPTDRTFDRFPTEQELDSALAAAAAAQGAP